MDEDRPLSDRKRPLILVVDDEVRIRRALARVLSPRGYDIVEAGDGEEAIALAAEHQPDIAVVDLRLPGIDGFGVVEAVRSGCAHIVVLSAADDSQARLRAFDAGADDFISKPANLDELIRRIDAARRMQQAWRAEKIARERAEGLHVMHSEAVSLLAHDLNNGFAVVMGGLQFLEETLEVDEEQKEAMEASIRALRRMIGLTSNFVDVSRLEDGAMTAQRTEVDVGPLVRAAAEIHVPGARGDRARLALDVEAGLQASIDAALMERVLHNLIGNALRYVDAGGTVTVSAWSGEADRLFLSVENTGSQVPAALAPRLFEKYRTGTDGRAMRGMGLYFCRLACEAHGGSIRLDTEAAGTRFVIEIAARSALADASPDLDDSEDQSPLKVAGGAW